MLDLVLAGYVICDIMKTVYVLGWAWVVVVGLVCYVEVCVGSI